MILENSIGWCDDTTNAVTGCDKVSRGCKNCYAQKGTRARVLRAGGDPKFPEGVETWGPNGVRVPVAGFQEKIRRLNNLCICDRCHATSPIKMLGEKCNGKPLGESGPFCDGLMRRIRLFADSNSDWLDEKWPVETLSMFLEEIHKAANVDVLLLTKRIGQWRARLEQLDWEAVFDPGDYVVSEWFQGRPPANLWLGVSVEDQMRADERIPQLLAIPAAVRFLSIEPLLEQLDLEMIPNIGRTYDTPEIAGRQVDWAIIGAESGDDRRDCGVEAIVSAARQCAHAGVRVYVKQDCAFKPGQQGRIPDDIWRLKQFPTLRCATAAGAATQ